MSNNTKVSLVNIKSNKNEYSVGVALCNQGIVTINLENKISMMRYYGFFDTAITSEICKVGDTQNFKVYEIYDLITNSFSLEKYQLFSPTNNKNEMELWINLDIDVNGIKTPRELKFRLTLEAQDEGF